MTEALREYLAMHAARRTLVQKFRKEHLPGGKLLTEDGDISAFLAEELGVEPNLEKYLDFHGAKPAWERPFDLTAEPPADADANFMTNEDMANELAKYRVAVPFRVFCTLRNCANGSNLWRIGASAGTKGAGLLGA